jgi:activator of HSP90 ATPase
MERRSIQQEVTLAASPRDVFETLLDPVRHATLSGAPAEIDRRPGGKFSLYGGHLLGKTVEFETVWRTVEYRLATDWPAGAISRVTFWNAPDFCARGYESMGWGTGKVIGVRSGGVCVG